MSVSVVQRIASVRDHGGVMILDGGLATELEARGYDINDPLWSAKVLLEHPGAIEQLHYDYLQAGAECIITASYQATIPGLLARGISEADAATTLRISVRLAQAARSRFIAEQPVAREFSPLIAASIGPYGAWLHDGSEYRGDYRLAHAELIEFHRARMETLAQCGPDLLACETIPCLAEAEALLTLLHEFSGTAAWFAFSCRDGRHTSHGEPIEACAALLDDDSQVAAIGVNCTPPRYIESLVRRLRRATTKPIVVYPNSGERWDDEGRCWTGPLDSSSVFAEYSACWYAAGATLIGGCCRTGPSHIRAIANRLSAITAGTKGGL